MGCFSIRPFPVLPVTNKQFFSLGKVHQTRLISLNLLSQVSVLLRTVLTHLVFSAKLRRFACKPELKDDTLTLKTPPSMLHRSSKNDLSFLTSAKQNYA